MDSTQCANRPAPACGYSCIRVVIRGRRLPAPCRDNRTCEPNPKLQPQYAEKAALFAEVYPTLATLNHLYNWVLDETVNYE